MTITQAKEMFNESVWIHCTPTMLRDAGVLLVKEAEKLRHELDSTRSLLDSALEVHYQDQKAKEPKP